jgi:ComF family protein
MILRGLVSAALESTLELLAPSRCAACESSVPMRAIFCAPCARTVEPLEPFEHGAAYGYGGALALALQRYKYQDRPDLSRALGHLLLRRASEIASWSPTVIVPVPLHPLRLAERRYNAPALLAARLASALRIPMVTRAVERVRPTAQQAALARDARRANVAGAFALRSGYESVVLGARVLVLDDVRTTGATLDACVGVIRSGGAAEVYGLALAAAAD